MVSVGSFAATMTNGSTPSRKKPGYWEGGSIPWVKTGEVNNNLLFKTNEHITELALAETSVHLLPKNTVVMALYGSGTAGRLAILQEKATTNQACTAMVCRTPSQAFYLFLTLQGMYREIDSKTRGSVQQNLSKDIVASLMIPAVTEDLLNEIRLCDIYDQVRANEYESLQLASLRDVLLPKLMSGEIDVSKVDLTQLNSHLAEYRPPCRGLRSLVLPDSLPTCSACGWSPGNKADQTETICESMLSRGEYGLHLLPRALRSNPRDVVDLTGGQAIKAAAKATRRSGGCRSRDILIQLVSGMTGTRCHQLLARARRSSSPLLLAVLADGDACRGCGRAGNA